jgi:hypothetical protein
MTSDDHHVHDGGPVHDHTDDRQPAVSTTAAATVRAVILLWAGCAA